MEPVTRKEHFLARIAGKPHDESLFPITREEFFLNDIAESGGGSSLINTQTTVLLPETAVTFRYDPEGSGTNPGDIVPNRVYTTVIIPAEQMTQSELGRGPQGCWVILDGGAPEEAVFHVGDDVDIGYKYADWDVEMTASDGSPAGSSEEEVANLPAAYTLEIFRRPSSYYLGEHTVSVMLYAVEVKR